MAQISGDETQIYDRQIRLWGMETQNRLRNSSVLIVGMSGLGAEIAKNLMLSGLKSLTLMDDKERAEASHAKVKLLNPMVEVTVLTESPLDKSEEFFTKFDLVIVVDQEFKTTNGINKICRNKKIRFQAGGVFGWIGYAFFDFNNHAFVIPKPKETENIVESVIDDDDDVEEDGIGSMVGSGMPAVKKMKLNGSEPKIHSQPVTLTIGEEEDAKIRKIFYFPSFEQTFTVELGTKRFLRRKFNFPASYFVIRAFLHQMRDRSEITLEGMIAQWKKELERIGSDESKQKITTDDFPLLVGPPLNPVCAIVGSIIGQEAIKALSQNDVPLKNAFFYSALEGNGFVVDMA